MSLPERKMVEIGELVLTHDPTKVDIFVGSCVGVVIYDSVRHNYALTHVIYPEYSARDTGKKRTLFADTAIEEMVEELQKMGSSILNLKAKLIGGARMLANLEHVGEKNVFNAKKSLDALNIPLVASDTGGTTGRRIIPVDLNGKIKVVVREKSTYKDLEYFV